MCGAMIDKNQLEEHKVSIFLCFRMNNTLKKYVNFVVKPLWEGN